MSSVFKIGIFVDLSFYALHVIISLMVKKHKKITKKKEEVKLSDHFGWWVALVILLIIIILKILDKNNFIIDSIFRKFRPTPTPTPTKSVKVLPPEGLNTDQTYYVKIAFKALAKKLKIKNEEIKVVSVKEKQWSDSSLGCPQKGYFYIQSITSGYVIELSAYGKTYIYYGGLNKVVSCQRN